MSIIVARRGHFDTRPRVSLKVGDRVTIESKGVQTAVVVRGLRVLNSGVMRVYFLKTIAPVQVGGVKRLLG